MKLEQLEDGGIGFECDSEGDEQSLVMVCLACRNVWQYPMPARFKQEFKLVSTKACRSCDPFYVDEEFPIGKHLGCLSNEGTSQNRNR